jgi:hypothetical protein
MFVSMGNVSLSSPGFVKLVPGATPNPGDYFYIATSQTSNEVTPESSSVRTPMGVGRRPKAADPRTAPPAT